MSHWKQKKVSKIKGLRSERILHFGKEEKGIRKLCTCINHEEACKNDIRHAQ